MCVMDGSSALVLVLETLGTFSEVLDSLPKHFRESAQSFSTRTSSQVLNLSVVVSVLQTNQFDIQY